MSVIEIDAALGGPWESLGKTIITSGNEDSSGLRRFLASALAAKSYDTVTGLLKITLTEAQSLRQQFVDAYGEQQ